MIMVRLYISIFILIYNGVILKEKYKRTFPKIQNIKNIQNIQNIKN